MVGKPVVVCVDPSVRGSARAAGSGARRQQQLRARPRPRVAADAKAGRRRCFYICMSCASLGFAEAGFRAIKLEMPSRAGALSRLRKANPQRPDVAGHLPCLAAASAAEEDAPRCKSAWIVRFGEFRIR